MKIVIGAIFKNEIDYIVEWIAWHQLAGFNHFIIADNESTDGTTQLLEALEQLKIITLLKQPTLTKNTQILAYNRISEVAINEYDSALFLDGDEFLMHDSFIDGQEHKTLSKLIQNDDVGMVGLNWRCFGSSGQETFNNKPVISRFTWCASEGKSAEQKYGANQFLKSASKISYIDRINPHTSRLNGAKKYIDSQNTEIKDFILLKEKGFESVLHSGRRRSICLGPLRVNHYVVKSYEEYITKKMKRGSPMKGPEWDKGEKYFKSHDFKDNEFEVPQDKLEKLNTRIQAIDYQLNNHTVYKKKVTGVLDRVTTNELSGWLVDEEKNSNNIEIKIYVNDVLVGKTKPLFYREDLLTKGISKNGCSGYRWHFEKALKAGDIISVKLVGNELEFNKKISQRNNHINKSFKKIMKKFKLS